MTAQSVCVPGGSGFVGLHLCAALARAGFRITVPTRAPASARHLAMIPSLRLVGADIHDSEQLARLCRLRDRGDPLLQLDFGRALRRWWRGRGRHRSLGH